jgi:hypothetical protein
MKLSSHVLSKNIKIDTYIYIYIYKTIVLCVILYGYETWSLTIGEEHRLRVYKNRVLRRIFGPTREEVTGGRKNCTMRSFIICTFTKSRRMR